MIRIYTTTTCASCAMVKRFLDSRGKKYEIVNLDDHPERQQEAIDLSGTMTVPVTLSGDKVVIGYNPGSLAQLA